MQKNCKQLYIILYENRRDNHKILTNQIAWFKDLCSDSEIFLFHKAQLI